MASDPAGEERLTPDEERAVEEALVRLNERAWGVAFGLLFGLGLFLATIILVVRGGATVGPHLALLGVYLRGYEVTWTGAFVGLLYGLVLGYAAGWTIGAMYNRLVKIG
jgi:hypothetical protein